MNYKEGKAESTPHVHDLVPSSPSELGRLDCPTLTSPRIFAYTVSFSPPANCYQPPSLNLGHLFRQPALTEFLA